MGSGKKTENLKQEFGIIRIGRIGRIGSDQFHTSNFQGKKDRWNLNIN